MRKRRKIERVFFDMMLQGGIASFSIVGLMIVFVRSFGDLAVQAIGYMTAMLTLISGKKTGNGATCRLVQPCLNFFVRP